MDILEIELKIKKIVAKELKVDLTSVTNDKKFVADLGADSLDMVELIMCFEDEFGIEILDTNSSSVSTVQDAINKIDTALNKN